MGAASFYDQMTAEQRAELEEAIAQAERGDVMSSAEFKERMARRFNFRRP